MGWLVDARRLYGYERRLHLGIAWLRVSVSVRVAGKKEGVNAINMFLPPTVDFQSTFVNQSTAIAKIWHVLTPFEVFANGAPTDS